MNELVFVNNIPLLELGVVLGEGSYKSLLQWSALKSVKTNSWAEYDYIEPDLSNPTLNNRTVTLNFHAQGIEGYETFLNYLKKHSENTFCFPELGVEMQLRINSSVLQSVTQKWQSFSLQFTDDEPFSIENPQCSDVPQYGGGNLQVDNKDLADFGVYILKDTLKSIRQCGKVKERLLINENSRFGAVYDSNGSVITDSNDFTVNCLLRGENLDECVQQYYALLNFLIRKGERTVVIKSTLEVLGCYYKSSTCNNVHKKLASGLAGINFSITFTLTDRGKITVLSEDNTRVTLTDLDGNFLIMR
ncbi:MAG: hypothetical protein II937_13880 [Bacteroidales bacterium]|nr:hypothetical protein [Bacteroidales bacterium]